MYVYIYARRKKSTARTSALAIWVLVLYTYTFQYVHARAPDARGDGDISRVLRGRRPRGAPLVDAAPPRSLYIFFLALRQPRRLIASRLIKKETLPCAARAIIKGPTVSLNLGAISCRYYFLSYSSLENPPPFPYAKERKRDILRTVIDS